ncbi:MAG: hypothetical protein OXC57_11805 [Rhodobacteraceae bacterium]|nr:hypothetical protein [Paracoccaceae bacterium]
MEWYASRFQVVWFVDDKFNVTASKVFEELTNQEPDHTSRNPNPTPNDPYLSKARGLSHDLQHRVQVVPGRVNWFIESVIEKNELPKSKKLEIKPNLKLIRNRISELNESLIGTTNRLSVVSTIFSPGTSLLAANRKIVELCNLPLCPEEVQDLSLQLNIKKRKENVEINRLARFSVQTNYSLLVDALTNQTIQRKEQHVLEVVLDFNTVPSDQTFDLKQQKHIFGILLDETDAVIKGSNIEFFNT